MNTSFGGRTRPPVAALLALALAAVTLSLAARPAAAQDSADAGSYTDPSAGQSDQTANQHPPALTYLGVSPFLTSFQNQQTKKQQYPSDTGTDAGQVTTTRRSHLGPLIDYEKLYFLSPLKNKTQYNSITIGAWYWYSRKTNDNPDNDRFAAYTQYAFDQRVAAQLSVGGGTRLGLYEFYLFGLYNLKRGHIAEHGNLGSRLAVQIGAGPYVPRRSLGNTGFTGLLNLSLAPRNDKDRISYSSSLWYVTYHQTVGGANLNKTNNTLRLNFNVNFRL